MSPESAKLRPPPAATPFTAMMTGLSLRQNRDTVPCRYVVSSLTSTPMRSRLSTKSLTSPPAQKARPAPVTTTQRIAGSSSTSSAAWKSSRPRPRLNALNASGRLSVIVATPSRRSRVKNWKFMAVVLRSGLPSALAGHARNDVQDVFDLQRLHHHQVDAVDLALLRRQLDAEAGDEDDRHRGCDLLDRLRHLPARDPRHRQVGEYQVEGLRAESRDRLASVGEHHDSMASRRQDVAEHRTDLFFVVDDQAPQRDAERGGLGCRGWPVQVEGFARRDGQAECGAASDVALDRDAPAVTGENPVCHREPEPGALRSLRGEERVEDLAPDAIRDADAGVGHRHHDLVVLDGRGQRQGATRRHGDHRG